MNFCLLNALSIDLIWGYLYYIRMWWFLYLQWVRVFRGGVDYLYHLAHLYLRWVWRQRGSYTVHTVKPPEPMWLLLLAYLDKTDVLRFCLPPSYITTSQTSSTCTCSLNSSTHISSCCTDTQEEVWTPSRLNSFIMSLLVFSFPTT